MDTKPGEVIRYSLTEKSQELEKEHNLEATFKLLGDKYKAASRLEAVE